MTHIISYKEQLSQHVENVFKSFSTPGLHFCDLATGGGKSYTIGKLTCEYYPEYFDRIVILCVQNKLISGMDKEIERFIYSDNSKIHTSDKLIIENNTEVITKAFENGSIKELLDQIEYKVGELKRKNENVSKLSYEFNSIKKISTGLSRLIKTQKESNGNDEYLQNQVDEGEANLRRAIRSFFECYKKFWENNKNYKNLSFESILNSFSALSKVYPQVEIKRKKLLIMTVHKAMYGIDPILSDKIRLSNFASNKKTLILFDESDQAAVAMRNVIIEQSINNSEGNKRFSKGYTGYLQYKGLIDSPDHISNEYYGKQLKDCIHKAQATTKSNWYRTFKDVEPYKNILLETSAEIEGYRRGVFFSGSAFKFNISLKNDNTHSYICFKRGEKQFRLAHRADEEELFEIYDIVVPLDKFLSLIMSNTTAIKSQLRYVISESLQKSRDKFEKEIKEIGKNKSSKNLFLGYPTLEREIHTLISRFETPSEILFEQQMNDFMTNRKNLKFNHDEKIIKLPDFSVYSQGCQLFLEEIDERDNQHRVRLSCREISTTPEKIILDLMNTDETSVVLCSATASSCSVVSNFDIKYLSQVLGDKIHRLSKEDRNKFDELVERTYPEEHTVEIVPIEKHKFEDNRENHISLPSKYQKMFSIKAQENGLPEKWFHITKRKILNSNEKENLEFQFNRLFQFIEVYYYFHTHNDIHSMLYFQNRSGEKDSDQFNVLSCLIDGSYTEFDDMDSEIPTTWENKHLRYTKNIDEVEDKILSELSNDKESKIMLVSAYNSFKAGANLQYGIPENMDILLGDNWDSSEKMKKDWDSVYLQVPTNYLTMSEDNNDMSYEMSLYNAMLTLMMLYERGCLSKNDVIMWMNRALSNTFFFGEKNNLGISKDKAAWVLSIVEQAVGRLCRTKNKPHTTYVLFDISMVPFFDKSYFDKSLTKEFHHLVNFILNLPVKEQNTEDPQEVIRCNDANYAQTQLDKLRRNALRYTPHLGDDEDFDIEVSNDNNIPYFVQVSQIMNQSYKQTILKHPVINSIDELSNEDKKLTFIGKCYGDWNRNENNEYAFNYEDKKICTSNKGTKYTISPATVRLNVLMKNDVIRNHFKSHGYATDWKEGNLILHPQILATDYAGEIGEEAFKALILHYTDCKEEDIVHLEGKDYELADFVIRKKDGSYKIAFDVKNMRPQTNHDDRPRDMPTTLKRKIKCERLNCEIITVNMLEIGKDGFDEIREIGGVIKEDGSIIPSAIERLRSLIEE